MSSTLFPNYSRDITLTAKGNLKRSGRATDEQAVLAECQRVCDLLNASKGGEFLYSVDDYELMLIERTHLVAFISHKTSPLSVTDSTLLTMPFTSWMYGMKRNGWAWQYDGRYFYIDLESGGGWINLNGADGEELTIGELTIRQASHLWAYRGANPDGAVVADDEGGDKSQDYVTKFQLLELEIAHLKSLSLSFMQAINFASFRALYEMTSWEWDANTELWQHPNGATSTPFVAARQWLGTDLMGTIPKRQISLR